MAANKNKPSSSRSHLLPRSTKNTAGWGNSFSAETLLTSGVDLPCAVRNFMGIPAMTTNPHPQYWRKQDGTCKSGANGGEERGSATLEPIGRRGGGGFILAILI